jgi:hypothetical protein
MTNVSCPAYSATPTDPESALGRYVLQLEPGTAEGVLVPEDLIARPPGAERLHPLWRVHFDGRPLSVRVHREEGCWLAEIPWLNICGAGDKPNQALEDAESHARYLVDYYDALPEDRLVGPALELKAKFRRVTVIQED